MRILVLSDVHANLTALEAVLSDAGNVDGLWCLGDLVGYGPYPNECIELIANQPNLTCLVGNHDAAVLGRIDLATFNSEARRSIRWTQSVLADKNLIFLYDLPERIVHGEVTLVHGSPRNPVWEYLLEKNAAFENFSHFTTRFCFVGHTHFPAAYILKNLSNNVERLIFDPFEIETLTDRMIINPGSVGQPRDHDPRASYALFDTEMLSWEQRRVEYDIHHIQTMIDRNGLPDRNSIRLSGGW